MFGLTLFGRFREVRCPQRTSCLVSSFEPLDSPRKLLAVILDKEYSVWYDIVWPLRAAALHSAARPAVDSALLQLDFNV